MIVQLRVTQKWYVDSYHYAVRELRGSHVPKPKVGQLAGHYEGLYPTEVKLLAGRVLPNDTVLDASIGQGKFIQAYLDHKASKIIVLDPSQPVCEGLLNSFPDHPHVDIRFEVAHNMEFLDNDSVDLVVFGGNRLGTF